MLPTTESQEPSLAEASSKKLRSAETICALISLSAALTSHLQTQPTTTATAAATAIDGVTLQPSANVISNQTPIAPQKSQEDNSIEDKSSIKAAPVTTEVVKPFHLSSRILPLSRCRLIYQPYLAADTQCNSNRAAGVLSAIGTEVVPANVDVPLSALSAGLVSDTSPTTTPRSGVAPVTTNSTYASEVADVTTVSSSSDCAANSAAIAKNAFNAGSTHITTSTNSASNNTSGEPDNDEDWLLSYTLDPALEMRIRNPGTGLGGKYPATAPIGRHPGGDIWGRGDHGGHLEDALHDNRRVTERMICEYLIYSSLLICESLICPLC